MNWRKRTVTTVITVYVLLMPVWPEENGKAPKSLSADEAVLMALNTHVDIQRSSISRNQAARKFHHAWNSFLPVISADGSGNERNYFSNNASDTVTLTAGVNASLSFDAGIGSKIAKLKSEYEAGVLNYNDTVQNVEYAVREAYFGLLYSKENLSVSQKSLASYQQQYDQTLQKRNKGVVPELDLLSSQVNLETAKTDLQSARSDYDNSLLEFLNTIGIEYDNTIELTDSLDYAERVTDIYPAAILDDCEEKSSEVKTIENKMKTAEYTRNQTFYSLFLPTMNVGAAVYPADYTYEKKSDTEARTPYWNVSLSISLPVDSWIPGSSAHDTVADLNDTIRDYELQLADKKKNVRTDIVEKQQKIEQAKATLKARQLNVELAEKSYEMTEKAYQSGTKDLLTLQSALDTYHSAQLQLSSEQYTLICNVFDLEKALGLASDTFFTKAAIKEVLK